MADYIRREDEKESVCGLCRYSGTSNCDECEHPIYDIKAADVRENTKGRWVIKPGIGEFCSKCNFDVGNDFDALSYVNFCPNCGADMRGVKDE